ncbi:hypothetical protein Syun_029303 [Stephania yunnanensis]|uniref:Amino acid transporter transmembrane domain-containing protein n=1 Tax=Stephania yunnanensis TaxID=152371 RepID=A0AAP0HH69_9MAGN
MKYALTMTPVAMSLEEFFPSSQRGCSYTSLSIRTILVLSTLVVGLTIPFFGLIMALIGSFLSMVVLSSLLVLAISRSTAETEF